MVGELNKAEVGKKIKAARRSLHLSREEFASRIPMSASFLQDVEGGTKGLSLDNFYKVIRELNVSADYLLRTDGERMDDDAERNLIFERVRDDMDKCDTEALRDMANIVRSFANAVNRDKE
ncbi:MAG: helix-turn-helix transcriptional regulator [Firmicutes bacterium]|nr:helix-turn-helix transcriptional regulator [Bacillota bacterium]MBQ9708666.1 helix-turn-helix transcriptional regulator [Bacillota bacterium]